MKKSALIKALQEIEGDWEVITEDEEYGFYAIPKLIVMEAEEIDPIEQHNIALSLLIQQEPHTTNPEEGVRQRLQYLKSQEKFILI